MSRAWNPPGGFFLQVDEDLDIVPKAAEGHEVDSGDLLMTVRGRVASLLKAERTALNFLQHLSGIATLTSRFVKAVEGTGARILDTRKTTPGLRKLQKAAVKAGGGTNHRAGPLRHDPDQGQPPRRTGRRGRGQGREPGGPESAPDRT